MSRSSMRLRSGRVIESAPPPPPPAPVVAVPPVPVAPAPIPPGPPPAPGTLLGLPRPLRMAILDAIFQGQPRVQIERIVRPEALTRLCLVNHMLKDEATEAYLRAASFQVTILSAFPDFDFYHNWVNRGQGPPPAVIPGRFMHTIEDFRQRVGRADTLLPSARTLTWGDQSRIRMARSAGEFPWITCPAWLKRAGPFIRDIQFNIIYPIPGWPPLVKESRERRLLWDHLIAGTLSVQVGSPGGVLVTQQAMAQWPPAPLPPGLGARPNGVPGLRLAGPTNPLNPHPYQGQCQRAVNEANRIRSSYLPAAPPPGAPGFRGFTLRDLREIAKAFSEPSIYVIQP